MKEKFTTKTIIFVAITVILAIVAATGVILFLKDSGEAAAIDMDQSNLTLPVSGTDEENNNQVEQQVENTQELEEENVADENEEIETQETSTSDTTTSSTTVQNIPENIEETVITQEKQVLDELSLSWTTIELSSATADLGVYKPELKIEKTAVEVIKNDEDKTIIDLTKIKEENEMPKVRAGDKITYEIKVSNIGNYKTTDVVITDSLDVLFQDKQVKAGEQIEKIDILESGKQVTVKVSYEVTENDVATLEKILNVAYATDEKTTVEDDDDTLLINPNVEVAGEKTWEDYENKYGTRPEKITVNLKIGDEIIDSQEVKPDENGKWNYKFTKLPKYNEKGEEIVYSIDEEKVSNYIKKETEDTGYNITNILKPEETANIPVTKTWEDYGNKYNTRPSKITVNLKADGKVVETVDITPDKNDVWKYEFTNLPKYNGKGIEIVYTISENDITDYKEEVIGYKITNTLLPEQTKDISGTKIWIDDDNKYGKRPDKIVVNLKIGNEIVDSQDVMPDEAGDWRYAFSNLPKLDINREEIDYTIQEEEVDDYTTSYNGTTIVNTLNQVNDVDVTATKIWDIPKGVTGATVARIYLYKNNEQTDKYFDFEYGKETTYTFENLPRYKEENGKLVVENGELVENIYTVKEEENQQYIATQVNDTTIKNTPIGIVEEKTTTIEQNISLGIVDVVFIVDVSASMDDYAEETVNAINSAMQTVKNASENNRIGIVTFSATGPNNPNTDTLKALDSNIGVLENVNNRAIKYGDKTVNLTGATYTQTGIEVGANMLISNAQTGRIPLLILVTDGEPTYCCENYTNIGNASGTSDTDYDSYPKKGYHPTPKTVFYTILTANYYKQRLESEYKCDAKFYTVRIGESEWTDSREATAAVLDPTTANINNYKVSTSNYRGNLSNFFNNTKIEGLNLDYSNNKFDYSDNTYTGAMLTEGALKAELESFVTQNTTPITNTQTRIINKDEIELGVVKIEGVKDSGFELTCENGSFDSLDKAIKAGIVEQDKETKTTYYVHLDKAGLDSQIYIKYNK